MHEMSYMIKLIEMAEEALKDRRAACAGDGAGDAVPDEVPSRLSVRIGAMTGVLPEYLKRYFPEAARGTSFEKSELVIEEVPVETECAVCKRIYEPVAVNGYACPGCGGKNGRIVHGRECELASIAW